MLISEKLLVSASILLTADQISFERNMRDAMSLGRRESWEVRNIHNGDNLSWMNSAMYSQER